MGGLGWSCEWAEEVFGVGWGCVGCGRAQCLIWAEEVVGVR